MKAQHATHSKSLKSNLIDSFLWPSCFYLTLTHSTSVTLNSYFFLNPEGMFPSCSVSFIWNTNLLNLLWAVSLPSCPLNSFLSSLWSYMTPQCNTVVSFLSSPQHPSLFALFFNPPFKYNIFYYLFLVYIFYISWSNVSSLKVMKFVCFGHWAMTVIFMN